MYFLRLVMKMWKAWQNKMKKQKTKNRFEIGKGANFCRIIEIIPKGKNVHKS
jgi:hypothetical protein